MATRGKLNVIVWYKGKAKKEERLPVLTTYPLIGHGSGFAVVVFCYPNDRQGIRCLLPYRSLEEEAPGAYAFDAYE